MASTDGAAWSTTATTVTTGSSTHSRSRPSAGCDPLRPAAAARLSGVARARAPVCVDLGRVPGAAPEVPFLPDRRVVLRRAVVGHHVPARRAPPVPGLFHRGLPLDQVPVRGD